MSEKRPAKVTCSLGPDVLQLKRLAGHEELGRAYHYEVELLGSDGALGLNKLLGKPMSVQLEVSPGSYRHFSGLVSRFSHAGGEGRHALYRATIRPWLWFLTRTANCRIFQRMTIPDVVKQVCKDHGFTDLEDSLTGSYREWEYLVQYRETDFNFVCRLLEQEGIYFFFKQEEKIHKLVLADGYSGHQPSKGYEEIPWFPPDDHARRERDFIDTINVSHNVQTGGYVIDDYDFERPKADLQAKLATPKEHPHAELEIFDYPGEYVQSSDGDGYVRARLESLHAMYEQVQGRGNARGLAVGALFKLKGYPREDQNREYLITTADYTLQNPDYESGSEEGPIFRCSFTAIDSQVPYRSPTSTPKPEVRGPQTAVVVGPKGEEIWTDKYGRVKVQFHWDREGKNDENSSCWVRVAQVWAGTKWGGIHIPRIGQEVIVDFLEGDPDRPIITGRVYNADQMPPYDLPANATQSGLKSRSSKGAGPDNFNELRFEDKKGEEQVYLHAEKDLKIIVEHDEAREVGNDRFKTVKKNETTDVGENRTEKVGKEESITIGGGRTESVAKDEGITVGGARSKSVAKSETVSIGENQSRTVGKNESVSIGGNRSVTIAKSDALSIEGAQSVSVTKDRSVEVQGSEKSQISKDHSLTVMGERKVGINKNDSLSVAKKLVINAGDEVTIVTGKASLTMKKDGTIKIKGQDITFDASGKINIKASGTVTVKGSNVKAN